MTEQIPERSIMSSSGGLAASTAPGEESARTMPLLSGANHLAELDETEIESADGRRFGRGPLLLVLVIAIGAGTLYLMRRSKLDVGASSDAIAVEEKIDLALARLAAASVAGEGDRAIQSQLVGQANSTEAIVEMFAADPARQQVPLEFLKKNPFLLAEPVVEQVVAEPIKAKVPDAQEKLRKLQAKFADLQLQTVMGGDTPVAIIDGRIVKAGATIGPFKVVVIENRTVVLESEGHQFRLQMAK